MRHFLKATARQTLVLRVSHRNLTKAQTKGAKWKHHKYIARVNVLNGYYYIYPDKKDVEKDGSLKPGAVSRAFNKFFFGEKYLDKKGVEQMRDGVIVGYTKKLNAKKHVYYTKYKKLSGFTNIIMPAGLSKVYKLPKKILDLQLGAQPAHEAPVKPTPTSWPLGGAASPQPGHEDLANPSKQTDDTKVALAEPLEEEEDPVKIAAAILHATLGGKKKLELQVGKRKLTGLDEWAKDKFVDGQELQENLRDKPVSALITLGMWAPTKVYKRGRAALSAEWAGYVRAMAVKAAQAYKDTHEYKAKEKKDKGNTWSKKSKATGYLNDRINELAQVGYEALFAEAASYTATKGPFDRFDNVVRQKIWNSVRVYSREQAKEHGSQVVYEEDTDDLHMLAVSTLAGSAELTAQEVYDLKHYSERSRTVLGAIVKDLHPTYRRVFLSRLWLDADAGTLGQSQDEDAFLEDRKARRATIGGSPAASRWERPWTGHGDISIANKYPSWKHPVTGAPIELAAMTTNTQGKTLERWYESALAQVLHELSTPFLASLHKKTPKSELVHHKDLGKRVLTSDGLAVQRWLQVERKLATINRRALHGTDQPVGTGVLQKKPIFSHLQREQTAQHPALQYFSGNQALASKIGINVNKFPQTATPNVAHATSVRVHVDEAHRYHATALKAKALSLPKLKAKVAQLKAKASAVGKRGHWVAGGGSTQWKESAHGVHSLHRAAVKVVALADRLVKQTSMTASETAELTKVNKKWQTVYTAAHAHHPDVAVHYDNMVKQLQLPLPGDLSEAQARAHQRWRHAVAEHAVHAHEHTHRTSKALVSDLARAFGDYEFELQRLGVEMLYV